MTKTVYTVAVAVAAQREREACENSGKKQRQADPHGDISSRLVKLHVPGVLLHEEHLSHDCQASDIKKKRLQAFEGDFVVFRRPVHGRQDEEHDPVAIPRRPRMSSAWGGLTILTSRP